MTFIPADNFSLILFGVFSFLMFSVILYSVRMTSDDQARFSAIFVGYILIFCIVVASSLPLRWPIPVVPILFLSVLIGAGLFAFSKYGKGIGAGFSMAVLVGFQGFRFPLELLLHHWANLGTVPSTMTWTGQNWDIISGLLSLAVIPFVNKNRRLALFVQLVGLVLLFNVMRVVIMSSPFPFGWPLENPMQLILFLPYALIAPLFVGAALAGHLITLRVLLKK